MMRSDVTKSCHLFAFNTPLCSHYSRLSGPQSKSTSNERTISRYEPHSILFEGEKTRTILQKHSLGRSNVFKSNLME
jgi:hypothetical protein